MSVSKLMIQRFKELLREEQSFAFETTGVQTNYLKYLKNAQGKGYEIYLLFLWLLSSEQAIERVRKRVKQGGHHISEEIIKRRYDMGLKNLLIHYLPLADRAISLDNLSRRKAKKIHNKVVRISMTRVFALASPLKFSYHRVDHPPFS